MLTCNLVKRRTVLALSVATLLAAGSGHANEPAKEPIKVGAILAMSGPGATFGTAMRNAIQVTAAQVNSEGGIDGRPVEVVFYDDRTEPSEAARGVTQLVNRDGVVAIVGAGTGGNTLAAGPVAQRMGVPLVAPVGTLPVTSRDNAFFPWVFRSAVNDRTQIEVILEDIAAAKVSKVGILYQEDAYGKTGADLITELAADLGMEVVAKVAAPYTATDLTAAATRLREAGADAVLMQVSISALGAAFMKAAHEVQLGATIYGAAGLAQRSFVESVDATANGLRMPSTGNLVYGPEGGEKVLHELLTAAGLQPQGWAELVGAAGFQSVVAAARSIEGEVTGQSMRDSLEKLCDFETSLRGRACFDETHESRGGDSLVIVEIRDRTMQPVGTGE